MELELGLALPNHSPMAMKGLDLNCSYSNNGMEIEKNKGYQKPADCFLDEVESKDLSLLLWSGQPNKEEDGPPEKWRKFHLNDENINDVEDEEIVGWPPLNSFRKKLLHRHHGGWMANHRAAGRVPAVRNSMYVKVKMEGVGIGRKIDLRIYNSYQALIDTLITMFDKYIRSERRDGDYTILYQDKEGDWMLAGDVPWETFAESVQRMEILRNDN
ncbi:hypothetical protein BUALT_Bualt05G0004600 [Buddleja alternifolia]|uniref:Auxin-responsive protein n=1 Tax=Buddleja alternifolia TaxID=168488 RepID=A0AAV6XF66_9LAMI|nr:hypothetical protein BUALT_Bualt05G0004600 [Buddleja alternifolia]